MLTSHYFKVLFLLGALLTCLIPDTHSQESIHSIKSNLANSRPWKLHLIVSGNNDTTHFSHQVYLIFDTTSNGKKRELINGEDSGNEVSFSYTIVENNGEFTLTLNNRISTRGNGESAAPMFNDLKKTRLRFVSRQSKSFLRLTRQPISGSRPAIHYYFSN